MDLTEIIDRFPHLVDEPEYRSIIADIGELADKGDFEYALGLKKLLLEEMEADLRLHPQHVPVPDVRAGVMARISHINRVEITTNPYGTGFTGMHSRSGLDDFVSGHPGSYYLLDPITFGTTSEAYSAFPSIFMPSGSVYRKLNNGGRSSFFPDSWDEARIIDEVTWAIERNQGPSSTVGNEHFGYSKTGFVKIGFYLNPSRSIISFFPKI